MFRKKETVEKRPRGKGTLKKAAPRVIALAQPHKQTLIIGFISLAMGSGISLSFPYLIGKFLNEEFGLKLSQNLPLITGLLVLLFAFQAACFYVRHYCFQVAGLRVVANLRKTLYLSILSQDISFFDRSKVGDLLSRLSSDAQIVQRAVTTNISVAVRYILQVIIGTIMMLIYSPKLSLFIIVAIPLIGLAGAIWGRKLREFSKKMQIQLGDASVVAEETVSAVRTVRMFTGIHYEAKRYSSTIDSALETGVKRTRIAAIFSSSMVFLLHSSIALAVGYGMNLVMTSEFSWGDLVAFLLYCLIVAMSSSFLASAWDEFMQAVGASERIFEIIDLRPEVSAPKEPSAISPSSAASVEFENVSFTYPSRPESKVLTDISFSIAEGQTLAFVGPSGAGKTTIAALIQRFYDPQEGIIRYSSIDLKNLDPASLREEMSVVAQNPQVFSVSVGENIHYGNLSASKEQIIEAAKAANIHDFVMSLPDSYDTLVGDKGIQLSGGERQRVAIARAILKNPKFLILDEATSSLDSQNEQLVQQALERLMAGRTTLVIAHRLSTVQHANKVIVLKHGQIIQEGSHHDLVETPGLYKTLVEHQLL